MNVLRSTAEHKYIDFYNSRLPAGTSPILNLDIPLPLSLVESGASQTQRVGDKVTGTSLEYRMILYPSTELDATQNPIAIFRLIIFIWKDDVAPSQQDILFQYAAATDFTNNPTLWPFNRQKANKYKILYDKTYTSFADARGSLAMGVSAYPTIVRKIVIPLTHLKNKLNVINFSTVTSLPAINHVYQLLVSNHPSVATAWAGLITTRYNYTDV